VVVLHLLLELQTPAAAVVVAGYKQAAMVALDW
jgi:hypothetical protein